MHSRCRRVGSPLRSVLQSHVFQATSLIAALALLLQSCDNATAPPPTYAVQLATGDRATAEVGTAVTASLIVTADGQPAPGIRIDWTADGDATVTPASSVTDAHGVAATAWTLGTRVGAYTLTASAAQAGSLRFSATATAGPLARLRVSPRAVTLADLGDSASLAAAGVDRFGNALAGVPQEWRSLAPAIASVSNAGTVHGLAKGTASIVVASGAHADTAQVEVRRPAGSVVVSPRALSFGALKAVAPLTAVVRDRRGAEMQTRVAWSSTDTTVVSVDSAGMATARRNGQALVRALADSARDSVSVSVQQRPARMTLNPTTLSFAADDSALVTATVLDSLGNPVTGPAIEWTSANPAIATASGSWVKGGTVGSTTLTARVAGVSATVHVTVVPGRPARIEVAPNPARVAMGSTLAMTATVADLRGNPLPGTPLQWSTSDPTRAAVSGGGVVTGLAPGTVTISAAAGAAIGTAQVTVVTVTAVKISQRTLTLNYVGARAQLAAQALDASGASLSGVSIGWTSLTPATATVSPAGVVTQVARSGTARIEASSAGKTDTATVTTRQVPRGVVLTPSQLNLYVGDTAVVRGAVVDSGGAVVPTLFTGVTGITGSGFWIGVRVIGDSAWVIVHATGPGSGTVTLTYSPSVSPYSFNGSLYVQVLRRPGASVTPHAATLNYVGATLQLSATIVDAFGNVVPAGSVSWRSLDPGVATVSAGRVTEVAGGVARIVASYGGYADTAVVTARQVAKTLTVTPSSVEVQQRDSVAVAFSVVDSGGTAVNASPWSAIALNADGGQFSIRTDGTRIWIRGLAVGTGSLTLGLDAARAVVAVRIVPRPGGSLAPMRMPDPRPGGSNNARAAWAQDGGI